MSSSVNVDPLPPGHTYALYARGEPVAELQWRPRPASSPGWYLRRFGHDWRRLAVAAELDAALADPPGSETPPETADLTALVSIALALDAAAVLLSGPPAPPSRTIRSGRYELHVRGLAAEIVPYAFPETIAAHVGDVAVLAGHFDDTGLVRTTRRVALLGGKLLALFHADGPADSTADE
jgi:hypothetical protein